MNKKELKEFNKKFNIGNENQGIIFTDDSGVKRAIPLLVVRNFISQIKANQRKIIKQDLLKIANKGECEDLRREVEDYFKKL